MERGEGLESVESVTHAKSGQGLSDYQSKEPCAVNIHARLWRTCYVPDTKLALGPQWPEITAPALKVLLPGSCLR